MSKTHTNVVKYWEVLERKLRGNDTLLSNWDQLDRATLIQSLILNSIMLEEQLSLSDTSELRRDLSTWMFFILRGNPVQCSELSALSFNFLVSLPSSFDENQRRLAWDRFKHGSLRGFGALLAPIRSQVEAFVERRRPRDLKVISQFLNGPWRVHYPSLDYSEKCLAEYYAQESKNNTLVLDTGIVRGLNHIMVEWCGVGLDLSLLHPKHGNGSVYEKGVKHVVEKYDNMTTDRKLDIVFPDHFGLTLPEGLKRECRVIFVPKSIKTWRVISAEDSALMYHQQAVLRVFEGWFEKNPILRRHINLRDSSRNCVLARQGSFTVKVGACPATIDLSAASDSVTWSLVRAVFARTPLMKYLIATRATHAELPDGNILKLEKFAPMGSAVCFPVETVIFAACCELIVRMYGDKGRTYYSVYGDDIVIDVRLARPLMELLSRLGMVVNISKSFYSADILFRESCGGEYYAGEDVTPLRLPRKFTCIDVATIRNASTYAQGISLINRLFQAGFKLTRSYLLQQYLRLEVRLRPLFSYDGRSGGVISPSPTNFHIRSKIDKRAREWQGVTYVHGCVTGMTMTYYDDEAWGHYLYYEWLRRTHERSHNVIPCEITRAEVAAKVATGRTTIT